MEHIETQFYETTFQVAAWSIQDPSILDSVTASDLANIVAGIMQSDSARLTLADNDIGILRVTDVTNPYFVDEKDATRRHRHLITLTHRQVVVTEEIYFKVWKSRLRGLAMAINLQNTFNITSGVGVSPSC